MKKIIISLIVMVVLSVFVTSTSLRDVYADTQSNTVTVGSWQISNYYDSHGTITEINKDQNPAPVWLQFFSTGLQLTGPARICHPFRQGQFGWVGEIRQLKNGNWIKLKTENDWQYGSEGIFMACAQASSAGTFALFGDYFKAPEQAVKAETVIPTPTGTVQPIDCSSISFLYGFTDDHNGTIKGFNATVQPKPEEGYLVTYEILNVSAGVVMGGDLTGTAIADSDGHASMDGNVTYSNAGPWTATLRLSTQGCSKDYQISGIGFDS